MKVEGILNIERYTHIDLSFEHNRPLDEASCYEGFD